MSVMKAAGVLTLDDAKRKVVLMGSTGKSGQTYIIPVVLNAMLGTKFKIVMGYRDINLIHLAMEKGEINGSAASWPTIAAARPQWVKQGLIVNLVTIAMEREPDLPSVPALSEVVTSAEDRAMIPLLAGPAALGRAWVAFGNIPKDRLAALRQAYAGTYGSRIPGRRQEAQPRHPSGALAGSGQVGRANSGDAGRDRGAAEEEDFGAQVTRPMEAATIASVWFEGSFSCSRTKTTND